MHFSFCLLLFNHYHSLGKSGRLQINDIFPEKKIGHFMQWRQFGLDVPCKLSPMETSCMKCPTLFSGENKKNISECLMLKKHTGGQVVNVPAFGSQGFVFESRWRGSSAHGCTVPYCAEAFIITLLSSQYDFSDV